MAPDTRAQGKTISGRYSIFATIQERMSRTLDSPVTSDETLVHYFTLELIRARKQWKHTHSPLKTIISAGKIMATVLCDSKGISFTWTFSLVKKPSMCSVIQLS
jgi:hypothetical protein